MNVANRRAPFNRLPVPNTPRWALFLMDTRDKSDAVPGQGPSRVNRRWLEFRNILKCFMKWRNCCCICRIWFLANHFLYGDTQEHTWGGIYCSTPAPVFLFYYIKVKCWPLEAHILICILSGESQSHVKSLKSPPLPHPSSPTTPPPQRRPTLNEFFSPSFNEGQERVTSFPLW